MITRIFAHMWRNTSMEHRISCSLANQYCMPLLRDYNQATKRFNSLVKEKRADGSPVINARAANYYLRQINAMTVELKKTMDLIIEMVASLELKQEVPEKEQN